MPKSLTSDHDYLKLKLQAETNVTVTAALDADAHPNANAATATTVAHALGEIAFVRTWVDINKDGNWHMAKYNIGTGSTFWASSSSTTSATKVILNSDGTTTTAMPVYYKIYANGDNGFTSDELYDKIFAKGTSSSSIAASGSSLTFTSTIITIPHSGGEVPLPSIEFSEDNSDFYEGGSVIEGPPDTTTGPPGGPYSRYFLTLADAYADEDNIYITIYHNYASIRTVYIRYILEYVL